MKQNNVVFLILLVIVSVVLIALPAYAQTDDYASLFDKANALYKAGNYKGALGIYQKLSVDKKGKTAEVFYNLANCYIKTNDLGRAIAAYKYASYRTPRDKTLGENLSFARSLVKYTVEDKRNWYMKKAESLMSNVTLDELGISLLTVYAFVLIFLVISLSFQAKKVFKKLVTFFIIITVIMGLLVGVKLYFMYRVQEAVVVAHEAEVRYGPSENDKVVFRLTSGIEVVIKEKRDGWDKIALMNAQEGWTESTRLEEMNH
jgi:tetratricopeptide (TPR) repeat protein